MFFVFLLHSVWVWVFLLHLVACGTLVLQLGIEPMPLQWNHGVLTAEPLENLWNHLLLASVSVSLPLGIMRRGSWEGSRQLLGFPESQVSRTI